jgi:hypothetical protein
VTGSDGAEAQRVPTLRGWFGALVTLVIVASVEPCAAQDAATRRAARDLAKAGVELLKDGKYAEAQQKLRQAYALYPAPTVALFEGQALENLGRLVEAAERYESAKLFEVPPNAHSALKRAVLRAAQELERLTPLIPELTVELSGADATTPGLQVQVDGKTMLPAMVGVPLPIDPGEHSVVVVLNGSQLTSQEVTLAQSQSERIVLQVTLPGTAQRQAPASASAEAPSSAPAAPSAEPEAEPSSFPHATIGWVSLGVGAAGLATGVVTGLMMMNKDATLEQNCDPQCPREYKDDLDAFETYRTVSTVGYAVGILGVGAGVALLLTAPSSSESEEAGHVTPWVGIGRVGVRGVF